MRGYVLDASVAVTALTEPGSPAADLLSSDDAVFQVPSIFDAEVLSALRAGPRSLGACVIAGQTRGASG